MTTSVWIGWRSNLSAESLWVAVDDTRNLRNRNCWKRAGRLAERGAQTGRIKQAFFCKPFAIEQPRLIFGAVVAQDRHDGVSWTQPSRNLQSSRDIHAAGAAQKQAFIAQQSIDGAHAFNISHMHGVVDRRVSEIRGDASDAN